MCHTNKPALNFETRSLNETATISSYMVLAISNEIIIKTTIKAIGHKAEPLRNVTGANITGTALKNV